MWRTSWTIIDNSVLRSFLLKLFFRKKNKKKQTKQFGCLNQDCTKRIVRLQFVKLPPKTSWNPMKLSPKTSWNPMKLSPKTSWNPMKLSQERSISRKGQNDLQELHCLPSTFINQNGSILLHNATSPIDWLTFNGLSIRLGLFYTERQGNRVHCPFIFAFLSSCFLKSFFSIIIWFQVFLSNTNIL